MKAVILGAGEVLRCRLLTLTRSKVMLWQINQSRNILFMANLRHDCTNIKVKIKGILVDPGRRKPGTIMGDNVHTGINSMLSGFGN